jgi:DNA-binding SARP family transcriptional activator
MHELYLLGGIDLRADPDNGKAANVLSQSKVVATLAYLALAPRGRQQRRDKIVGLLWPELDQEHARAALRKSLHVLRGALGDGVIQSRGDEELILAPNTLWCDVASFREACDKGELVHALKDHERELMPGFHLPECSDFDMWLEDQRHSIQERRAAAAWALAERFEMDKKKTEAGQWAREAVKYSGTDERVLRRTMTMLDRLGDRAGALRVYAEFARRLKTEYNAEPSAESKKLAESIRAGSAPPPTDSRTQQRPGLR